MSNTTSGFSSLGTNQVSINDNTKISQTTNGHFKLLNFNIEWGGIDEDWKTVVKNENADVLTLVETGLWSPDDGTFDAILAEINSWFPNETPYQGVTYTASGGNDGEAILSRFPIVNSEIIYNVPLDDGSNWAISHPQVRAEIDFNGQNIHVLTNHLTCCAGGVVPRASEQEGIMNYLDNLGNVPIIYSGDFNSDSPEDIGNLAPLGSDLMTPALDIMLNSSHPAASKIHTFKDVFRTLNPEKPGYTQNHFWEQDINRFSQRMSRTDYIFVNQLLTDAMLSSEVITTYEAAYSSSDHLPLVASFDLDHVSRDLKPPKPPTGMQIDVDPTNLRSTLSWNANTEIDFFKYQVYRNDCLITEISKDQQTYTDDYEYEENVHYYYELRAVDETGNVSPVNNKQWVNTSSQVVTVPGVVTATATGGGGGINITWTDADNGGAPILFYAVFTSNSANSYLCTALSCFQGSITGNAWFHGLRTGVTFSYFVRAFNFVGGGLFSNIATTTSAQSNLASNSLTTQSMEIPEISSTKVHQSDCPTPFGLIDLPEETTTSSESTPSETETTSTSSSKDSDSNFPSYLVLFPAIYLAVSLTKRRKDIN